MIENRSRLRLVDPVQGLPICAASLQYSRMDILSVIPDPLDFYDDSSLVTEQPQHTLVHAKVTGCFNF
jgi:hypothetical protein